MQLNVNPYNTAVTALTSEDQNVPAHIISYGFHNCHHVVNRLVCCTGDPMCFA
jgi:hypothetical protein